MKRIALVLLALLAAAVLGVAVVHAKSTAKQVSAPTNDIYHWLPHLYDRVSPKVVTILVQESRGSGLGSGVIWSSDGYIVTDAHVVAGAQNVQVALPSGTRVPAKVVGTDTASDLAVIKVDETGLPTAQFAKQLPQIGQLAVAIGSPLGFQSSMTQGIVSGLHRNLPGSQGQSGQQSEPLVDLIQTDAAISPGNSGGALVNEYGVVVGINEAYIPPSQGAVAIGFATPAPTVTYVVKQLIKSGKVEHAFLGIQPADITPQVAQQFKLQTQKGALVQDVVNGSAAAQAGLQPGDVITKVGNRQVNQVADLIEALRLHKPGDQVQLTIVRSGSQLQKTVTLASRPPSSSG